MQPNLRESGGLARRGLGERHRGARSRTCGGAARKVVKLRPRAQRVHRGLLPHNGHDRTREEQLLGVRDVAARPLAGAQGDLQLVGRRDGDGEVPDVEGEVLRARQGHVALHLREVAKLLRQDLADHEAVHPPSALPQQGLQTVGERLPMRAPGCAKQESYHTSRLDDLHETVPPQQHRVARERG
eukprot:CAMPEP_0168654270 /NCGR_PEP_ID=MMETSP0503-20121227/13300_1 /TAXON_ID=89963 /ORGANISM="Heterocapsa rotundata, Strain SCCAP K-0483" /LENGTH=184 /DNA_ID=CAMNT_0008698095 /DNA_START=104 /DNA_END=654 /DNA_ORIENTATION=+